MKNHFILTFILIVLSTIQVCIIFIYLLFHDFTIIKNRIHIYKKLHIFLNTHTHID